MSQIGMKLASVAVPLEMLRFLKTVQLYILGLDRLTLIQC